MENSFVLIVLSFAALATGQSVFVAACHCMECQRRTCSPFGVSTHFPKERVRTKGPSKIYVRGSDSGRQIELWYSEVASDLIVIAFGALADPSMPWPTASIWETTRHPWVTFDHRLDHFVRQPELEAPVTARR